jgi:hypothetical protein
MNKITINTEGVQNLLQHLKPNKATGPDDIPAKFLKEVNIEISPLISLIFQASLDQGQIPSDRFFRNPCCNSERTLLCSRWVMMVE